ncbi:MAG: transglutaminase-like domain-containing protein [Lachnospiraceae bacterium]|nr:transglutaminase-like domain-containing protein [Lachnospiraceae bacterium]
MRISFPKKKKENTADISLVKIRDNDKYDFGAAVTNTLILFMLVYGAIGGFLTAFEIAFHSGLCMISLFALAFVLSVIYETGKRWLTNLTALAVFLLYLVIAIKNYWVINSGYYYIINRIFDVAREYLDISSGMEYSLAVDDGYMAVTTFAIFLGMVGIILLNIQLHNKCTLFGAMFLTLTPYVIPMYFECSQPLLYSILVLIGYAMVMVQSYGWGRVSTQMRYLLPVTALAVALLVRAAAFIIPEESYARIVPQSESKKASEQGMERVARYGMLGLFPQDTVGAGVSGGRLSKGAAVVPSYETALIVRYTPYSFQPVYLKAFTGLDYVGTSWTEAEAEWPGDGNMEMSLYSRESQFKDIDGAARQGFGIMEVEKTWAGDTFEYRPYYTDYCNIEEKGSTLVYHYYPDNGESVLLTEKAPYERYLDVPVSCETAVRQVCEEAGFKGTEKEIAQQITEYFDENYNYTLRPGFYYGNPDYISHFLLESRKGYCAHFASAAAMLFRQMGIPARYVEGYAFSYAEVVENGELVEGADYADYYRGFSEIGATALIQIEIPDAYAHAWVEIYDNERGWIVVDPTPSSTEEETASFWEVFMQSGGGGTETALGEDILGGYLENALGILNYVLFAVFLIAVILFTGIRMIRKEKERRLSGRERIRLEYGRLQKAAVKKSKDFQTLRTLKEQIAWMKENCRMQISDEQETALYQAFFGKEIDYDCDRLCRELRNSRRSNSCGCIFGRIIVK